MSHLLRILMGNCLISCRPNKDTPACAAGNEKILRIVKTDGKVLEYRSSILVKELLANFNGFGVGASQGSSQFLTPDYELNLGQIYYLLPCVGPVSGPAEGGVKRIKVVITKQQLQELLSKNISVEDMLSGLQREKASHNDDDESVSSNRSWKPELETIPE